MGKGQGKQSAPDAGQDAGGGGLPQNSALPFCTVRILVGTDSGAFKGFPEESFPNMGRIIETDNGWQRSAKAGA